MDSSLISDLQLAKQLQAQFDLENVLDAHKEVSGYLPHQFRIPDKNKKIKHPASTSSIVDPEWEDLDPTPDLHALFLEYNEKFFGGRLSGCEVKWSPRMTLCAGVCSYQRRSGYCSIRLNVPLLKLRPRKDLVETLLHEMIHAYLFVTDGNDDHDGHGPAFHEHMFRINKQTGTNITVYHNFHDEVALYKTHWWKCNGPCQHKPPFYGMVKRSMNRAPGPYDWWFPEHQTTCGGQFIKIKEPEDYGKKKLSKRKLELQKEAKKMKDIRSFAKPASSTLNESKENRPSTSPSFSGIKQISTSSKLSEEKLGSTNEVTRSFWANKFQNKRPDKQSKTKTNLLNKTSMGTNSSETSIKFAQCPVCNAEVLEKFINSHLDECLTVSRLKDKDDVALTGDNNDDEDFKAKICKKCNREVYIGEFQVHQSFCDGKKKST